MQNLNKMDIIKKKKKLSNSPQESSHRRKSACLEMTVKHMYRRAFSEVSLLDACREFNFSEGTSYHFITAGDVDSLTYLKAILRQQSLDYCLLSTWCIAAEDIIQLRQWLTNGKIKNLDIYVGEIFPNSYKIEFDMLKAMYQDAICGSGRLAVFRNHSKIYAGYGRKFYFGVETSANVNTNPRTENGCITIHKEIFDFYKSYFDEIKSFSYGTE